MGDNDREVGNDATGDIEGGVDDAPAAGHVVGDGLPIAIVVFALPSTTCDGSPKMRKGGRKRKDLMRKVYVKIVHHIHLRAQII